ALCEASRPTLSSILIDHELAGYLAAKAIAEAGDQAATLHEIARIRPASMQQFRMIKGVGGIKASQYGKRFINFINQNDEGS
ncbi:MAG: HRDC domain-containing protein, partial [Anaerolineaceae bacterium]|nr:HRDC domain-containing protein [Anaerolineaceae bacterium]